GRRFSVSISFVSKLHKRARQKGTLQPDAQGGDRRSPRIDAHGAWLISQVNQTPNTTLEALRRGLASRGVSVAVSTIWRFLKRHEVRSEGRETRDVRSEK